MNHSSRIEYIDACRGFAILSVVMGHVLFFSYGYSSDNWLFRLIYIFHMPLFFFLSGYLTFTPLCSQNSTKILLSKRIHKKISTLLVPTIVIIGISVFLNSHNLKHVIFDDPMKLGYWFTFVLFQIVVLYHIFQFFIDKKLSTKCETIVFILIIVGSYLLSRSRSYLDISWIKTLSFGQVIGYSQYFFIGILAKKFQSQFLKLCTKPLLISLLFVISAVLFYLNGDNENLVYRMISPFQSCCTMLFVFILFYTYQNTFSSQTKIGKSLIYIGQHTLEIYFLHYFFLFKLPVLADYFNNYQENFVLMIFATFILSVIIIAFSLLTMKIIQVAKPISFLMFGPK